MPDTLQQLLQRDLAPRLEGDVHTSRLRRYMHATDGSIFFKQPAAVIYPAGEADVLAVVRFAARHAVSVHARGAGSGLCGSALGDGLIVDFSKYMNRLLALNTEQGWFECQPGYRFGELADALQGSGWFFPPDPSSGEYATFGGMYATNASGSHSVKYGNVADYLMDARIILADGTAHALSHIESLPIAQLPSNLGKLVDMHQAHEKAIDLAYPSIACNVAGYNLRGLVTGKRLRLHRLLAGAEGTLALTVQLRFRLAPKPASDSLVVAYFDDIVKAAKAVRLAMPLAPSGIEIMDKSLLNIARTGDPMLNERIPDGIDNVLLLEWDGPSVEAGLKPAQLIQERFRRAGLTTQTHLAVSEREKQRFWAVRKAAVPILYKLKGRRRILALVEDAAVAVDQLAPYFMGIYELFKRFAVDFVLYGHIAKGLMHTRPLLDLKDPRDVALLRPIADAVYELVRGLGGTVSGEHGDGRLRSAYLQRAYPLIYDLFIRTKTVFDPRRLFNPEIKTAHDPDQMTRHLRFGADYKSGAWPKPRLKWGQQSVVDEIERCHGCSRCTTLTTVTRMCPVYKVTKDESASPKAKANVLRALISGGVARKSFYEREFQQVIHQCIHCGSCFSECPSNVNIPKLVMEARAHYVRRFGADRGDALTARVETAARWLGKISPVLDPLLRSKTPRQLLSRCAGLAPERGVLRFSRRSLYDRLPSRFTGQGPRVLFFAGCYAAYIRPELGEAAVAVLRRLGFDIVLPRQFCCGLPQLSKGMPARAAEKAKQNIVQWGELLPRVDYIAVTCSSCGYALLQDWSYLLPEQQAMAVREKIVHINRLADQEKTRRLLGPLAAQAAYHQPCHLRIQPDADSAMTLLSAIPKLSVRDLKSHCCGIAGSWGMLKKNYPLSKTMAGPMLDRLTSSGADLAVTDCPTCQMQIEHLSRLAVVHPIELVRDSLCGAA